MKKWVIGFIVLSCLMGCEKMDVSEQIRKEQKERVDRQIQEFENIVHVKDAKISNVVNGSTLNTYIVQYTDGKKVWEAHYQKNNLLTIVEVGKVVYSTKFN